ncbi:SigE family RNA polymerase sigma factor [Nocardioides nitrophenolicus]|uniref:SigE family RNA polymerase sigma factor n=1 Tax=Nocardioides nitrophenolicus TaxID=60489 RepID=UPI00195C89CC|nr:SigE family RNA polymerase sigma factor [Nocardioides nitrophenolicus]MBM7515432.1 RNA polymerase sigma-70 factor (sigma-E family) [Nocardioides nitrophenolicus]
MRAGEQAEFEEFVRARSSELLRAAWLLTGSRPAAEDLLQETLVRVLTRWSRVRRADNPVAYARTVLVRRYVDSTRRRSAGERPGLPDDDLRPAVSEEPDVALRQTLVAALRELAPVDRAVVVQRYLLDQDVAGVAADLGLTGQAVRSRSSRALARLRHLLDPDLAGATPARPDKELS